MYELRVVVISFPSQGVFRFDAVSAYNAYGLLFRLYLSHHHPYARNDCNENASLYELITCVNTVKDLSEFDALLDSKLASQK